MGLKNGVESATTGEGKAAAEALYQKEAALLQKRNKAYNDFCEENGLKRKSERITIAKWDRARAAKARAAARRTDDQKRQPPRIRQEYYSDENTIFNNTSGQIIIENGYNIHSHANEINAANIVMKKFGGEIHLIPESTKEGEKRPDLLWNGKMWEVKNTSTAKSVDTALRTAIKQIETNPGGIILNFDDNDIDLAEVENYVNNRMSRRLDVDIPVIIIHKGKVVKVMRRKNETPPRRWAEECLN